MCTVTFIPKNNNTFVLTSNRDELRQRTTLPPISEAIGSEIVFFPKDTNAGGTWIAAAESGRFCCLLNGAFEKHIRQESYRRSRGLILLDSFTFPDFETFANEIDLTEIEPFTLLSIEKKEGTFLSELRWDGQKKHFKVCDENEPHIWASATLYSEEIRSEREKWFASFLEEDTNPSAEEILNFHASSHGNSTENNMLMQRESGLQTVSITQMHVQKSSFSMTYADLVKGSRHMLAKEFKHSQNHE